MGTVPPSVWAGREGSREQAPGDQAPLPKPGQKPPLTHVYLSLPTCSISGSLAFPPRGHNPHHLRTTTLLGSLDTLLCGLGPVLSLSGPWFLLL